MIVPDESGPDQLAPPRSRRRSSVTVDPVDVARAARTIPHPAGDPEGPPSVDADVWLWHVAFERLRSPDLRALLVEEYTPYAHSLARRAYHGREPLDDLRQVAMVGLIGALERFACARSIPFAGFAAPTIIGALKRHHRDNDWAIRIPRRAHTVATSLGAAEARLDARVERGAATRGDLAAELGIDEDELTRAQVALRGRVTTSLDAPLTPGSRSTLEVGSIEDGYGQAESRVDLVDALEVLTSRDRSALTQYFFEDRTQVEIGRTLGVSQMQVSRTLRSALARLRRRMELDDGAAPARQPRACRPNLTDP